MDVVIIVLAIVAVVGVVAWFALARKHPENAAAHPGPTGAVRYSGVSEESPAGPGAEAEGVADRGVIVPGPMPEAERDDDAHSPPWSPG